jgi:5-formaminoimidazole-4-carboxamide-1-beta-D-ribofuranosyl 5'-monophosphate synthetase
LAFKSKPKAKKAMFDKAMELGNKIALDLQSSLQKGDLKKLITQKRDLLYYQG